jgi:hypothetical protein
MKTLRKYAAIALLLISATAIIPTFGSSTVNEQEKVKQEEIAAEPKKTEKVAWYNKEIQNKNGATIGTFAEIAGFVSVLASVSAFVWYTGIWRGILPVKEPRHYL